MFLFFLLIFADHFDSIRDILGRQSTEAWEAMIEGEIFGNVIWAEGLCKKKGHDPGHVNQTNTIFTRPHGRLNGLEERSVCIAKWRLAPRFRAIIEKILRSRGIVFVDRKEYLHIQSEWDYLRWNNSPAKTYSAHVIEIVLMISFTLNPCNLCVDCPDDPVKVICRIVSVAEVTVL